MDRQTKTPFSTSKKHGGGNLKIIKGFLVLSGRWARGTRAGVRAELSRSARIRFELGHKTPPNLDKSANLGAKGRA
jgi:hypothetical protein